MAPSLRCPRCATVVSVQPGIAPVCPACGFAAPAPGAAPSATAAASSAAPPPAPPLGGPAALRPLAPLPGAPAMLAARGKVVHPGLVVLFHVVTLGIYFFVFWWRTSREVDEAQGWRDAHGVAKAGILMMVLGAVAVVLIAVAGLLALGVTALQNADDPGYSEEDLFRDFLGAGIAFLFGLVVFALLVLAGRITLLVGQYRLWKATHALETGLGLAAPISVAAMLTMSIIALVVGGGNGSRSVSAQVVGGLLGLAALVLYFVVAYQTQAHLNRVWEASAAAPPAPGQPGW